MRKICLLLLLAATGVFGFTKHMFGSGAYAQGFSETELAATAERAKSQSRLLVVTAVAEWNAPCHKMDRTTWADRNVREWMANQALFFKFDVEEHPQLKKRLRVPILPTTIIIDGDREVARRVGYQSPGAFLNWLEDLDLR